MHWIYLSPHLDDVALSCGGLLWEQSNAGADRRVSVWTICAGDPPAGPLSPFAQSLHQRWETGPEATSQRRLEDIASCKIMGASYEHFPIPDCIYRTDASGIHLYASEGAIMGAIHPAEMELVTWLGKKLAGEVQNEAILVCPLALGGHVDHRLTRAAAERTGHSLWYYADYPYVLRQPGWHDPLRISKGQLHTFSISDAGLQAWVSAVGAHRSQISTFWPNMDAMQAAIEDYARQTGGMRLWELKNLPSRV